MIDVETEVNKHKNCKDRAKLESIINEYKSLVLKHANNLAVAGQYNMVVLKLQEICDRLPGPPLRKTTASTLGVPVKTAAITKEESTRIDAEWKQKAGSTRNGGKQ